jgi:hypothetical protein
MSEEYIKEFETFAEEFKQYEDNKSYDEMASFVMRFDANKQLILDDLFDTDIIVKEISEISKKLFYFGNVYESQKRVVQELEDEYGMWEAKKYLEIDDEKEQKMGKSGRIMLVPIKRTETHKEQLLKVKFEKEYMSYQSKLRSEKYKLGLLKRVVTSMESYSYKLSNILEHSKEKK